MENLKINKKSEQTAATYTKGGSYRAALPSVQCNSRASCY